ncbi:MAG: hypothetical protein NZ528_08270 [Caldilineales bacterium]|nr:hypothetical protein [Caldilineales bacterium]MDW8316575.1 hypothetical protein [Anaerolineae bacterium]
MRERDNGRQARQPRLSQVAWQTGEPIPLPAGAVRAYGDAWPQVRSPERLAQVGDLAAQAAHVSAVIVQALAGVLEGMEPTAEELAARREDIASATLVSANSRLSAVGVALLDLQIVELAWV